MSTDTQILYQIVFGTKCRQKTLDKQQRDNPFKYITRILQQKKCPVYQIGGVEDLVHIVSDLHPTVALASLVKHIEMASTEFIKTEKLVPNFGGWQNGYGAFTYSIEAKHM
jgi:putative transposase